jgi:2-keto-4-pentenoate hydratase
MDIRELARRQLADYDLGHPGTIFSNNAVTLTVEQAYKLQREVASLRQARGEPVVGYKIGCVSPVMQAQLHLDRPVFGHIYGSELHRSGVVLDPKRFDGLAIEGELAVRLKEDVPDVGWLRSHRQEVIGAAFAVIELHNYVFRNSPHTASELIGNNAIHAGVVMPLEEPRIQDPDELLDEPLSVWKNGERLGTETGRALPDGPFGSLVRLAEHLAQFGRRLERGELVLTGSPLPLFRVALGDTIEVRCEKLGQSVTAMVVRS